jgi:hypothetical protein
LESDCERMDSEGLAIHDSCAGPEITRQGPKIQPFIELPGIARDHSRAVGTYVFGETLLGRMANVQTAEIDSYGQGNAFFQAAGDSLHQTPHGLTQNGLVGVGGGNDKQIIRPWGAESARIRVQS